MLGKVNKKGSSKCKDPVSITGAQLDAGWTAPADGTMVASARGASGDGNYYIQDTTNGRLMIMLIVIGTWYQSGSCPVIKGHTYKKLAASVAINACDFYEN